MAFTTHNGVRLHWRWDGSEANPPIVLLNSLGTDMSLWDRALNYFLPHRRVLRIDTRGHGASDAPRGDYALTALADDVRTVMTAAGVTRAPICGVSLGGMVAMTMAVESPDCVEALIPACTSAALDVAAFTERARIARTRGLAPVADLVLPRFFTDQFRKTNPEVVDTTKAALLAMDPEGYAGCCAAVSAMNISGSLSKISVPTLVIAAGQDPATPFQGHGDRIVSAINGARTAHIDGAHLACLENPAEFTAAVLEFLRDISPHGTVSSARKVLYDTGLMTRRRVLGDVWVDKSLANRTALNSDFQEMITRIAWNEVWTRPGLDFRTRRLLVIAITAALGRWEEFRLHVRSGLEQGGFSQTELKEVLMQTAIYAGVPAANTGFTEAAEIIAELSSGK